LAAPVDKGFLDSATTIWQVGRIVPLAGIGSRTRIDHDFLPTPVHRIFLRHLTGYTPPPKTRTAGPCPRPAQAGRIRPSAPHRVDPRRHPELDRRTRLQHGDVVIRISGDEPSCQSRARTVRHVSVPYIVSDDPEHYILHRRIDLEFKRCRHPNIYSAELRSDPLAVDGTAISSGPLSGATYRCEVVVS